MRMRQSLSELERAFFEEAEADRLRRERLYRQAAQQIADNYLRFIRVYEEQETAVA